MFKTRFLSAIVGLVLLFGTIWAGKAIFGIAIFIIAAVSINEFYNSLKNINHQPIKQLGFLFCVPILLIGFKDNFYSYFHNSLSSANILNFLILSIFILLIVLFFFIVFKNEKYNIIDISVTAFGILYVPFLYSFIVLTRNFDNGFYIMWLIFIGAWCTDTFAYFAGRLFGKTKILPVISPKKTLEGSIGGTLGCIFTVVIYGIFVNKYLGYVEIWHFIIIGIISSFLSQLGDWSASAIKRFTGIKDYGKIMPGHGGFLDRFDSILFIAPFIYFYTKFIMI